MDLQRYLVPFNYQELEFGCTHHFDSPVRVRYFDKEARHSRQNALEARPMSSVMTGVKDGNVNDMLEYAFRLAVGLGVPVDIPAVINASMAVAQNQNFDQAKRAIAFNLAIFAYTKDGFGKPPGYSMERLLLASVCAEKSAIMGNYSIISFLFVGHMEGGGRTTILSARFNQSCQTLLRMHHNFKLNFGVPTLKSRKCTKCGAWPPRETQLKQCSGPCSPFNKPRYCGKKCQAKDWGYHRTFCRDFNTSAPEAEALD